MSGGHFLKHPRGDVDPMHTIHLKYAYKTTFCLILTALTLCLLGSKAQAGELATDLAPATPTERVTESTLPEGTLGPVTLKASLQQTQTLPVSLLDILNLASGKSLSIQLAQAEEKEAKTRLQQTWAELLPDVTLQYTQSRFVGVFQIFGGDNIEVFRTTYQPQVSANYTLYPAGKNLWEIKASKERAQAQINLTEETRQKALLEVSQAYYQLQKAYWLKAITLQALAETQKRVALTEARFNSGIGLKLDWLQAKAEQANRQSDLLTAESAITQASQQLAARLDMDLNINLVPTALDAGPMPLVSSQTSFEVAKTLQKQEHPQLHALQNLHRAAKTDVIVRVADLVPQINVTGYFNGTGPALDRLGLSKFGGVQVSTNLFENMGLAKPLQIKQAKTAAHSAELSLREATRFLEASLAQDWTQAEAQRQKINLAREGLTSAKLAYEQAFGRLEAGVGTSLDVDVAQTRLTQARQNVAMAFLDFNQGQLTLLKTLGTLSLNTLTQGNPSYGLLPVPSP